MQLLHIVFSTATGLGILWAVRERGAENVNGGLPIRRKLSRLLSRLQLWVGTQELQGWHHDRQIGSDAGTGAQAAQGEGTPGQADPSKFSGKKSKAVAKQGGGNTQWAILKLSGIPESEIPSFRCCPTIEAHASGAFWHRSAPLSLLLRRGLAATYFVSPVRMAQRAQSGVQQLP